MASKPFTFGFVSETPKKNSATPRKNAKKKSSRRVLSPIFQIGRYTYVIGYPKTMSEIKKSELMNNYHEVKANSLTDLRKKLISEFDWTPTSKGYDLYVNVWRGKMPKEVTKAWYKYGGEGNLAKKKDAFIFNVDRNYAGYSYYVDTKTGKLGRRVE